VDMSWTNEDKNRLMQKQKQKQKYLKIRLRRPLLSIKRSSQAGFRTSKHTSILITCSLGAAMGRRLLSYSKWEF